MSKTTLSVRKEPVRSFVSITRYCNHLQLVGGLPTLIRTVYDVAMLSAGVDSAVPLVESLLVSSWRDLFEALAIRCWIRRLSFSGIVAADLALCQMRLVRDIFVDIFEWLTTGLPMAAMTDAKRRVVINDVATMIIM